MGVGGHRHALASMSPGMRDGTNFAGRWVGPRADMDCCEKPRPASIRSLRAVHCGKFLFLPAYLISVTLLLFPHF
jgi:hypothetical protein